MIKILSSVSELINKTYSKERERYGDISLATIKQTLDSINSLNNLQDQLKKKTENKEDDKKLIENFMKWMISNGFNEEKCRVTIDRNLKEGTGLIAKEDIEAGQFVLSVPEKLFMTLDSAQEKFGEKWVNLKKIAPNPTVILALHLMCEALIQEKSFWAPYIKVLPKGNLNLLLDMKLEDFEGLFGSPVYEDGVLQYRNYFQYYLVLYDYFNNNPGSLISTSNFTWRLFSWAISIVLSRQNKVPFRGKWNVMNMGLIPFWDFANHSQDAQHITTSYDPQTNSIFNTAALDTNKGEQLYMYYGDRPNFQLFLFSGFTVPINHNDGYKLSLCLKRDELYHSKLHIIEERGLCDRLEEYLTITIDNEGKESVEIPDFCIPFYRIYVLNKDQTKSLLPQDYSESGGDHKHSHRDQPEGLNEKAIKVIDVANETLAYKFLLLQCKLLLRTYPITIDQDLETLEKSGKNSFKLNILRIKKFERRILTLFIQKVESIIQSGINETTTPIPEISNHQGGCNGDHGDHGHSHGGGQSHGHSHGESNQSHGHSHGDSNQGHGHSHGESNQGHGHSHGDSNQGHGHSHGGGQGHSHQHGENCNH